MGEISEMMLDGTLCAQCGEFLGSDNDCPTLCNSCMGSSERHIEKKEACSICHRGFLTMESVIQHMRNKHYSLNATGPGPTKKVACRTCGAMVKKGQGLKDHLQVVHGVFKK